jgi:hypothetical protein
MPLSRLWIAHLRQTGQRHRLPYWAPFMWRGGGCRRSDSFCRTRRLARLRASHTPSIGLWAAHLRQTGQRHRLPYWTPFMREEKDAELLAAFRARSEQG